MNLFSQAAGNRPRTACEITPEGVVAARAGEPFGTLAAAARVSLAREAVLPGLIPGNLPDRVAVIAAVRRALEAVGARPNSRGSDVTVIIPDGAARVLLLDFDTLPGKLTEALPLVRFRLKKLLPFDADHAMISYQVMSSTRGLVRVLAVAIPRDVLTEYETAVREAGFEPGAVLPSTLATLPGVTADEPVLLINGGRSGVTTAIVRGETLLLHRTVDLQGSAEGTPAELPPAFFEEDGSSLSLLRNGIPADRQTQEDAVEEEIAQAVSVAVAYFEDTLSSAPRQLWSAGALPAGDMARLLERQGLLGPAGLEVRELAIGMAAEASAVSFAVPPSLLAGVAGALRG